MSPINIPIKPPPRVNTANDVNDGGGKKDRDGNRRREERGNLELVEEAV